jgi:flagellar FliL protein
MTPQRTFMADPKDKKPGEAKDPAGARAGGSKLVVILLAVNGLLTAGVLGVLLLRQVGASHQAAAEKKEKEAEKGEAAAHAIGPMLKLADLVVHLRDTEADRYARVSFDLEVATEEDKNRLTLALPRIRDGIIAFLADRSFDELRGSEGLEKAKGHLLERVQQAVPGTKVKNLYISDIVVQ